MTATLPRPDWGQAPVPAAPDRRRPGWQVLGVALVVLGAPVLWGLTTGGWPVAAGWLLVGLLLAAWVAPRRPALPLVPAPGPGAVPGVVVLTLVSAWLAATDHSFTRSVVPYALALLMPVVTRWGGGAVERWAARLGRAVGHAVSYVLFTLLGLLTIVLPWVAQRLVRTDPLHTTRGWNARQRRSLQPTQPWAPDAVVRRASPVRRTVTTVAALAVLGVAVVTLPPTRRLVGLEDAAPASTGFETATNSLGDGEGLALRDPVPAGITEYRPDPNGPQAAMKDSPWFEGAFPQAQGWALNPRNAWRPVNVHRLRDFSSEYLNIVNGERRTWAPPVGSTPRLTVWLFGGSTTYGLDQRDEHTIASELARAAAAKGIALDIHNKGQNGHLHWMESERFAWDLTTEAPPDLVLFYDGVNEVWEAGTLNRLGTGDSAPMHDPTLLDAWDRSPAATRAAPSAPPGAARTGWPQGPDLALVDEAKATIDRYDRARRLSQATAAAYGIPVRYFWQPDRFSRPVVLTEPHDDTDRENRSRLAQQLRRSFLPKDVADLSDSLDGAQGPLFTDDVHHNEEGARLIAAAMFTRIEGDLQRLVAAKKGTT